MSQSDDLLSKFEQIDTESRILTTISARQRTPEGRREGRRYRKGRRKRGTGVRGGKTLLEEWEVETREWRNGRRK